MYYYETYHDIFPHAKNDVDLMDCFQMFIDEHNKDLIIHNDDKEMCSILQDEYAEMVDIIKNKYLNGSDTIKLFIEVQFNL